MFVKRNKYTKNVHINMNGIPKFLGIDELTCRQNQSSKTNFQKTMPDLSRMSKIFIPFP